MAIRASAGQDIWGKDFAMHCKIFDNGGIITTSANKKRLDEVEIQLTPKQRAIRLADEAGKSSDKIGRFRIGVSIPSPAHSAPESEPIWSSPRGAKK